MRTFNPVKKYWDDRMKNQPSVVKEQIKQLLEKGYMTDELVFIQRKRPKLKPGDVFVVQPKENIFFYGLIIGICSRPDCKCQVTACIFRNLTNKMTMNDFRADFRNLLLPPLNLFKEPWTSGYFYNIGHADLDSMQIPSYAFYHIFSGSVVTAKGEHVKMMPELIGLSAICGIGSVALQITQELIIDPSILTDNKIKQADFCLKFPNLYFESLT